MNAQDIVGITDQRRRLEDIRDRIATEMCAIGMPPGVRYDTLRVQSTPENRLEAGMVKIEMLRAQEERLQAQIAQKMAFVETLQDHAGIFSSDEWKVFKCRYFEGYTYTRIEQETGFSFRKVRRIIQKIRKKVQNFSLTGGHPIR